jgi:hypothetical protein
MIGKLTITIRDAKARTSRMIYHLNMIEFGGFSGDTLADLQDWINEVVLRLDALIIGVIDSVDLSLSLDLPSGLDPFALSTSDVEEKAYFDFPATANGGAAFANSIPTFNHAKFPPGVTQMAWDADPDVAYLAPLLFQPDIAIDWTPEYGGIADNRGIAVKGEPLIYKRFKR